MISLLQNGKKVSRITVDGKAISFIKRSVKGYKYAYVTVRPGKDYTVMAKYASQ